MYPASLIELSLSLPAFLLVATRVSGMMITAPLLGSATVPARLKAGVVLVVSATLFPAIAPNLPTELSLGVVLSGLAGELMIGLIIGIGLSMILLATQMTGMIVGQQAGLALASAFDPATQSRSSVIGQVYFLTATALFLLMDGHRAMVRALMDSFQAVPVMSFNVEEPTVTLMSELMMSSLTLALRLGAPMVIALLLAKAGLGFLSRTMPQLHILSVGFAIFVGVGMLLSGWEMDNLYDVLWIHVDEAFDGISDLIGIR
jgi:flagellar biosynthetic protein FliR